jgi:hypothetical protein
MSQARDPRSEDEGEAAPQTPRGRHPFKSGDEIRYLGPRSNRTWGSMQASGLAVGKIYKVENAVWATATDGELVSAVRLVGVLSVTLENGRTSRSYAADNFALVAPSAE